jgi:hypothetical protein
MSSLTRILGLIAAGALVAVTAANFPARSGESGQGPAAVGVPAPSLSECRLLKRAISTAKRTLTCACTSDGGHAKTPLRVAYLRRPMVSKYSRFMSSPAGTA